MSNWNKKPKFGPPVALYVVLVAFQAPHGENNLLHVGISMEIKDFELLTVDGSVNTSTEMHLISYFYCDLPGT